MIRRREFISLLGGAAGAWPLAARAQQAAMPVIGFLHPSSPEPFGHIVNGFRRGLSDSGFVEGQNVAIEFRWARGEYDQLPALAAELVQRGARVILAGGGEVGALAAKAATSTIPILVITSSDPVSCQLQPAGWQRHRLDDGHVCVGSKKVWPAVRDDPESQRCCDAYQPELSTARCGRS
jgi:putative ABC transport system substrate-binding protein